MQVMMNDFSKRDAALIVYTIIWSTSVNLCTENSRYFAFLLEKDSYTLGVSDRWHHNIYVSYVNSQHYVTSYLFTPEADACTKIILELQVLVHKATLHLTVELKVFRREVAVSTNVYRMLHVIPFLMPYTKARLLMLGKHFSATFYAPICRLELLLLCLN